MTHHRKPETTTGQIKIVVKTFGHPVTAIQGRPAKQVVGIGLYVKKYLPKYIGDKLLLLNCLRLKVNSKINVINKKENEDIPEQEPDTPWSCELVNLKGLFIIGRFVAYLYRQLNDLYSH